jgi:hypothetical protein
LFSAAVSIILLPFQLTRCGLSPFPAEPRQAEGGLTQGTIQKCSRKTNSSAADEKLQPKNRTRKRKIRIAGGRQNIPLQNPNFR